jgi:hypothetical protein
MRDIVDTVIEYLNACACLRVCVSARARVCACVRSRACVCLPLIYLLPGIHSSGLAGGIVSSVAQPSLHGGAGAG